MTLVFKRRFHFLICCFLAAVRFCVGVSLQVSFAWFLSVAALTAARITCGCARLAGLDINPALAVYYKVGADWFQLWIIIITVLIFYRQGIYRPIALVLGWLLPDLRQSTSYVEDCPISGKDEDLLGRKSFEDKVMDLIRNAPEREGAQCIGIWGRWGIGKTSVMRRIEWRMRREGQWLARPIFVHFDPLKHSGGRDLCGAMFAAMSESFWLKFYGIGGLLGCVGSRLIAARLLSAPDIRHWAFDFFRCVLSFFSSDVDLQKRLATALRKVGRRVVVVVDDLDRLPNEEMCAIIRMLKSIGSLPNVTYVILANEPYLSAGVGSMVPRVRHSRIENGRDYLKKMVANQLELPDVEDKSFLVKKLREFVGQDLRTFWFKFDIEACDHLSFVGHLLSNIRDVKRVANGVRAALEGLRSKDEGECASVDIGDLVVLEAVRAKWPDFYSELPRMFAEFLSTSRRIIGGERFAEKYLDLVPTEGRVDVEVFLADYLGVVRCQEPMGDPVKMQWGWKLDNPSDYKKYEGYRLASEFCFDNYFETERLAKVVPRASLETAFDYVESGNVDDLVKTMQRADELSSLPELLFVLQNKYRGGPVKVRESIFRSLVRILEHPLKSHKLRLHGANVYGVICSQILRFAKELIISPDAGNLSVKKITGLEQDACCLIAAILVEEVDSIQKGFQTRYISIEDVPLFAHECYERLGTIWFNGVASPGAGFEMAMVNICRSMKGLGLRSGGLLSYRDWPGVTIPSIEIVIVSLGDGQKFLNTLWSVLMSVDAYEGAVSSCIVVVDKNESDEVAGIVREAEQFWEGVHVFVTKESPVLSKQWVTFVREGDVVSRNWFSLLAFESFHVSVDVVSFNYYLRVFDKVLYMRRDEIINCVNLAPYVREAVAGCAVALSFWNKMYKAEKFSAGIVLPQENGGLAICVLKCLLASGKIAHVDGGVLCHALNHEDADYFSRASGLGLCQAGRMVFLLRDTIYSEEAFSAMVKAIDSPLLWKSLFKKSFDDKRLIDLLCPADWPMHRFKMWMCSKLPALKNVFFKITV